MLNVVALNGRLTKDPVIKIVGEKSVVNFTLAVNRNYKNDGEVLADFIQCQAWGKPAEFIGSYVKKGNLVSVVGSIGTRNYDNDKGDRIYITEINVSSVQQLERKAESQSYANGVDVKTAWTAEWDKRSPGLDSQGKDNLKKELAQKYQPIIDRLDAKNDVPF